MRSCPWSCCGRLPNPAVTAARHCLETCNAAGSQNPQQTRHPALSSGSSSLAVASACPERLHAGGERNMTGAACARWHRNSAVLPGVLLLFLLALTPASSERSCLSSLSAPPAFVAPAAGTALRARDCGGFLQSNVQLKRAHTRTVAGHRELLPPLLGPNHAHDSLGRPPPHSPAGRSGGGANPPSRGAEGPAPPPGEARTSRGTSRVVAAAAGRQGGAGEEGEAG
ncbi:unnamed protein product, partial [Scytosiphon promiscuus]